MSWGNKPPIDIVLEHFGGRVPSRYGWTAMFCPFHEDRTRSASVNVEEGRFHCHACDVTGDVYGVVMTHKGVGFREARSIVESITGTGDGQLPEGSASGRGVPRGSRHRAGRRRYVPPRGRRRPGGGP